MQVYAIITQNNKVIITQKAELNTCWNAGENLTGQVVNQAGQYALPGGGREDHETPEQAARRETLEETGYTIPKDISGTVSDDLGKHKTVTFLLPQTEDIQTVYQTMKNNVRNNPNNTIKPSHQEHQDVLLIDTDKAKDYLGVKQPISKNNKDIIDKKTDQDEYCQAIDWFAAIALTM